MPYNIWIMIYSSQASRQVPFADFDAETDSVSEDEEETEAPKLKEEVSFCA
jgi:hypothetical protein